MTKNEAEEHLKKSTVKIDSPYGVGSGFFIDKNLIATCHHVVKGCSASELEIVWQGSSYQATSIESNRDDDLALVSVKIETKHPCVQIDKSIEIGDACFSFGFPEAYRELGDTLTFVSEGHNEKFLKFKDGQFESGFSGAPILNYRTLKVCGVVKRTRDEHFDFIGGRGIPISKLFGFKGLDIDDNGSIFSKEMFKNWVWTSSVESADRLQFSVLALVETLVAVGVSLYLWIFEGFYYHIVVGLIVAPLFFLRTKKSEKEALIFFNKYTELSKDIVINTTQIVYFLLLIIVIPFNLEFTIKDFLLFILFIISLPIMLSGILLILTPLTIVFFTLGVKFIFTIKNLSIYSVSKIPKNWFKLILSTDMYHTPELIAGIEKTDSIFRFSDYSAVENNNLFSLVDILIRVIIFLPTLIFRYSLKSTAWIYLPLIWLIQPQDRENLTTRFKIESKNFIAYLMFFYSLIVVFVFTLLPLIFPHTELGVYFQTLAIPETLKTIFFAYQFNLWHLTRFLSALITIVFMMSFTKILIRRETEPSYGDFWGAKLLSLRAVRSVLTLITLGFTAYHILGLLPEGFFGELWANMKVLPEG